MPPKVTATPKAAPVATPKVAPKAAPVVAPAAAPAPAKAAPKAKAAHVKVVPAAPVEEVEVEEQVAAPKVRAARGPRAPAPTAEESISRLEAHIETLKARKQESVDKEYKKEVNEDIKELELALRGVRSTRRRRKAVDPDAPVKAKATITISPELQKFIGSSTDSVPRQDITREVWNYIKNHKLNEVVAKNDSFDRRMALPDASLTKLFGQAYTDWQSRSNVHASFGGNAKLFRMVDISSLVKRHVLSPPA